MPLDTESPAPERSLKRARELEDNAVERVCAVKRHRLLTPSSSDQPLDKTIASPNILSAQPDSHTRLNRFLEKNDTAYEPASKLPILNWLAAVPPHRTESAPARLNSQRTLSNVNGERYQYPSVKPFQETPKSPALDMPQPQGRSIGGTSIASGQGSRHATSSSIYRSILRNNGVFIDHVGEKIPEALRKFVDRDILKTRTPKLSPEAIAATMKKAIMMADSAEGNIYDLVGTAMFSVKRDDVSIGGNTPWSGDALPRSTQYSNSLATPKPDVYIGYTTDMQSTWTIKENAVVDHPAAVPYTRPTRSSCFPFLVFELKSEAAGGTLWQAENQAAGSGSHCVNSMRWFLREAYSLKAPSILDTVAFTIAVTHREAIYYVHFYSEEDDTFYMSCIGNFSTLRSVDIQRSNDVTENILEHGLGTRQQMIRSALEELSPCPERWKSIGTCEAAAPSAYAAWTSQLAVYDTYTGTSDLFAFATTTDASQAAPSSKVFSATAAFAPLTQTTTWPMLSLVQQPEPHGVQCMSFSSSNSCPAFDPTSCTSTIAKICTSLDNANKEGSSSSNTDKWVFVYGGSKSSIAGFWLRKSAAGTGKVPMLEECQANVYGRMLSLCYINGNVNWKYDNARVDLVHSLLHDTIGVYLQGKGYNGEQVDARVPSYQLGILR